MKTRLALPLTAAAALLLAAFSTGSPIFLFGATLLLIIILSSFVSVWWAAGTLTVSSGLSGRTVRRGESVTLEVTIRHGGLIPIAPVLLELYATPEMPETQVRLKDAPGKTQRLTLPFHAAHVGVSCPGVKSCTVEDVFGLFSKTVAPRSGKEELLVLPLTFDVEALKFSPGDPGSEIMARATEDVSNPSDFRNYQPGDAIKKIHWKLSARKGDLMVRRYEEPVLSDALVLMDCSPPPSWGHPEAEADIRDTLLETAASVMVSQMTSDHAVRLPLMGEHPVELDKNMGTPLILENLARVDFSETDQFERVLLLETRRMRRVGATVIISARLSSRIVDVMIRMKRMGPNVRLYLVTFTPDDPLVLGMVSKLQQAEIEVSYVTPVPA
ncbi:MAG: DUF58 domain-containing protein [Clostridia bacterium]|nr:DUF58 domain-containing protein [Clostridia bacterium]